jgi:hypothetical protein
MSTVQASTMASRLNKIGEVELAVEIDDAIKTPCATRQCETLPRGIASAPNIVALDEYFCGTIQGTGP